MLQVRVEPGSYKVGAGVGAPGRWEQGLDLQEREWVSKERGNTVMVALLVRLE